MNPPKAPKPNDDPVLAMSVLWHRECDHFYEMVTFASRREQVLFDAADDAQAEAERLFLAAAEVRDKAGDKLEVLTRAIFRTKAQTFEGAAAKLAVAIRDHAPSPTHDSPPWPDLRSVQADLDRLVVDAKAAAAREDGTASERDPA